MKSEYKEIPLDVIIYHYANTVLSESDWDVIAIDTANNNVVVRTYAKEVEL